MVPLVPTANAHGRSCVNPLPLFTPLHKRPRVQPLPPPFPSHHPTQRPPPPLHTTPHHTARHVCMRARPFARTPICAHLLERTAICAHRRNAIELSATSSECGLLVKATRQLTQSVNVVVSVSVMCAKCSRTIFSTVSNAMRTIMGSRSPAAVVKTCGATVHTSARVEVLGL
eukprot:198235-Chlamydomonas_euryale.AAC.2